VAPTTQGSRVVVRARAKVNLGLEILGRRADGYHELSSLLWAIDLSDWVTLDAAPEGIVIACDAEGVPATEENLCWRAADLLRREAGVRAGVRIRLDKVIPVAAGLGGGSADAAAVLAGLTRLWHTRLGAARLAKVATALGMDVPFFLGRGPAVATGRGEVVRPVTAPVSLPLVLVNPGFPLATREVFARLGPADFTSGAAVRALRRALAGGVLAVAARLANGMERVVGSLWPGLAEVKGALVEAGCLGAVMSGSGPTVVGLAATDAAARRIAGRLRRRTGAWRVWATRTVCGPVLAFGGGPRGAR
jgi:4-diphosphocytidyl-2-C-methyl-D-erythritol kinase